MTSMMIDFNVCDWFLDQRHRYAVSLWLFVLAASCLHGLQWNNSCSAVPLPEEHRSECRGTHEGLTDRFASDPEKRYPWYREQYENCTVVTSNLEITHLVPGLDMSFLENIREVHGYVLIAGNRVDRLPLTSLRIIRGLVRYSSQKQLPFREEYRHNFSLYVAGNIDLNRPDVGLKELHLPALREILRGSVLFKGNHDLCYDGSNGRVNWAVIMRGERTAVLYTENDKRDTCTPTGPPICDASCKSPLNESQLLCWGPGPDLCQKLTSLNCSESCNGRCFGPGEGQCCDPECAGGCHGAGDSNCWGCKNVENDGRCEKACPPYLIYDTEQRLWLPNPNVKYSFGTKCLNQCPSHMYADKGACVSTCGPGRTNVNGTCEECKGPCPLICPGTTGSSSNYMGYVHAGNIANFTNCTAIEGGLDFINKTFKGDKYHKIEAMSPDQLDALADVMEIRDYLKVNAQHENFTSLSFLRNLQVIKGQNTAGGGTKASLVILATSLRSLGLVSLTKIENGNIVIKNNDQLCYTDPGNFNWFGLLPKNDQRVDVVSNANRPTCEASGSNCSPLCSARGCWGAGDGQCVTCIKYRRTDTKQCLESCSDQPRLYTKNETMECLLCHVECRSGCTGPGPSNCDACLHVRDVPYCVDKCPPSKYSDKNGVCQPCHPNCDQDQGCTGPEVYLGYGGCKDCARLVYDREKGINSAECLNSTLRNCEKGSYFFGGDVRISISEDGDYELRRVTQGCRKCDPLCERCSKTGPMCDVCKFYRMVTDRHCINNCSSTVYPSYLQVRENPQKALEKGMCMRCHPECRECSGALNTDCRRCENKKIYVDQLLRIGGEEWIANYSVSVNDTFFCDAECPHILDQTVIEHHPGYAEQVCLDKDSMPVVEALLSSGKIGGISTAVIIVALFVTIIGVIYLRRQMSKSEVRKLKLRAQLSGLDHQLEELHPTNMPPDMSCLRLCKESELRRGEVIGSGAFGTVFRGVFMPERENVKIPVAIKELSETSTPGTSTELLEEARIMATVQHPCCIRIMAVCMTKQMMLVTPLMPCGSLLDYLRRNRTNIGSHVMLLWSKQIAEGMNYLESLGIVHRDLAARNVLVHGPHQLKITDFGLAKLLDCNEESYLATGGKLPIKWLALECIQYRKFTHKSDVWSFGVTLWELYTYGQRPFEEVKAIEMARALEKGVRLPQPTICTIDVYMLMIKCWLVDTDSRPTFAELSGEFSKMAKDPARYLVVRDDALMRLPSVEQTNMREFLRGMSFTSDGSELMISAEEYLEPQGLGSIVEEDYENTAARRSDFNLGDQSASCGADGRGPASPRSLVDRETSVRYTKDPCTDEDFPDAAWPTSKPPPPKTAATTKGDRERLLRTNDDGYLETPTMSGKTSTGAPGPVVDDYLAVDSSAQANNNLYLEMSSNSAVQPQSMSNPEYYDPNQPPQQQQPQHQKQNQRSAFFNSGNKNPSASSASRPAEYLNT